MRDNISPSYECGAKTTWHFCHIKEGRNAVLHRLFRTLNIKRIWDWEMSFGCIKGPGGFVCKYCDRCSYKPGKIKQCGTDPLVITVRNRVISCKVAVWLVARIYDVLSDYNTFSDSCHGFILKMFCVYKPPNQVYGPDLVLFMQVDYVVVLLFISSRKKTKVETEILLKLKYLIQTCQSDQNYSQWSLPTETNSHIGIN